MDGEALLSMGGQPLWPNRLPHKCASESHRSRGQEVGDHSVEAEPREKSLRACHGLIFSQQSLLTRVRRAEKAAAAKLRDLKVPYPVPGA